jgi:hypothetical protein
MSVASTKTFDADIRADTGISERPGQGVAIVSENRLLPPFPDGCGVRRSEWKIFVSVSGRRRATFIDYSGSKQSHSSLFAEWRD